MQAQAQFTIHSLNDVIASTTAPSSPYKGQLWVNTSYSPPRTFVYNGSAWKEQNGTDTLRSNISTLTTKSNTMQSNLDGLTSTVSLVTTRVETVENDLGVVEENVLDVQTSVTELEQTASDITLRVTQNENDISSLILTHNSLEARISDAEGNISILQVDTSMIGANLSTAQGDIVSLKADVSGIKTRVSTAEGDISTLEQTATSLTSRVSNSEGKITTLTSDVNGLKTKVSNAEGDISSLETSVSGITTRVSNSEKNITTLQQTASSITTRVTNAENDISSLTQTVDDISIEVSDNRGNISSLTTKYNSINSKVSTLSGKVTTIEQTVDEISLEVADNRDNISSITQTVDEISVDVADNKGNISTLTTRYNSISSTVSSLSGKVTTVEQTVSGLSTKVTNAEGDISALEQDVDNISTRIGTAEGDISSLEQTTSSLSSRISTAEGNISTLTQTTTTIAANVENKADKEGGTTSSFGWKLTTSGFYLYSNGSTVMSVTSAGLTVSGAITATSGSLSNLTITGRLTFGGNTSYYIDPNYNDGSYYISLPGFRVDDASGAVFSGKLSAPSGTIGGFTITSTAIYKTKTTYSNTTAGVYIGTDGIGLGAGTFYVTSAGALTAKSGTIGGFTIGTSSIYKTKTAYSNTTAGVYLGTDGIGLGAGTFYVTSAGALTAKSATITGTINATGGTFTDVTITGSIYFNEDQEYYLNPNYNNGSWYIYLPNFRVDDTSAYFSGTLQAPSGTIGGFTISTNKIYKTKTSYSSSTAGVYIGTDGIGLGAGTFYVTSAGALTASNVKITGGSIALGSSSNQNYLSMTSSRILFGVLNEVYTQINWSGITVGLDQWYVGTCNRVTMGAFGGADTGISSFGIHSYLDPDGDNIFTISAEDTDGSYMGSGYIELRIGTTYSKCYGYLGGTWKSSSSITVSSDRNIKNSITDMPDAYSSMFDKLRPVIFKYNEGTGGRYHTGFIAQEVAEAVTSSGLTLDDFAAVCAPYRDDDVWGIRYEEIIALNTWEIQKLKAEIKALKAQIGGYR